MGKGAVDKSVDKPVDNLFAGFEIARRKIVRKG
jgi:hypothetical protein